MWKRIGNWVIVGCLTGFLPCVAAAQAVHVGAQKVSPQTSVSSLTISASPAFVNFNLVSNGVAAGSSSVAITTTWGGNICLLTCTINLYAYFASSSAALSDGGSPPVNIPSSEVLGEVPTGTPATFTPFTQTNPLGGSGSSLKLFQQSSFLYTGGGSRTDSLSLEIDLANQPQLPAGTYNGTLYIQAQSL